MPIYAVAISKKAIMEDINIGAQRSMKLLGKVKGKITGVYRCDSFDAYICNSAENRTVCLEAAHEVGFVTAHTLPEDYELVVRG